MMLLARILYVEVDPDIQFIAKLALEQAGGYLLQACRSGDEALAAVAAGCSPDLLLPGVIMPGMDGLGALAGLRSPGAIGVIARPFDPTFLAGQVRQLWERKNA